MMGVQEEKQSDGLVFQNGTLTTIDESNAISFFLVSADENNKMQDVVLDSSNPLLILASVAILIAFALVVWSRNRFVIIRKNEGKKEIISISYLPVSLQQEEEAEDIDCGGDDDNIKEESKLILSCGSAQID